MSVYHGKLLELLSIERKSNQSFLRIKLSFEQDIELLWKIDHDTAEHLKAVTVLGEFHKYRLSFHSSWDSTKNQNVSFLTRTYRDQSDRIYFPCSEPYVNGLNTIKYCNQMRQIHNLPFLTITPLPIEHLEQEVVSATRFNRKFAWTAVAMMSAVSTILLSYSLIFKTELAENSIVKAEALSNEARVQLVETEDLSVNEQSKIDSSRESSVSISEPSFPIMVLDEVVTYSIPEGSVALTFDDGPSKYTKEITDILKKYQVGGTFFFIGRNVKKYPSYVQYVKSNGYSIGSHSMSHPNLKELSYEKQEYELLHTNQLIEEVIKEKVVLFRPPYGSKNDTTLELVNKNHNKMVLWNTDTEDWKSRNPDKVFNSILKSKASGSIILLHESQIVVDTLPKIIEHLQEQDLKIVNLR